jgi:MFS transporter, DHA1 family, tetracycline resistance protein
LNKSSRAPLLVIFLTVFIDLLGFGIVLPLLPRYAKHFAASGLTLGLLMASFSAMQFVFAPIWGRVSDRVGRRPILMLGLAGSAFFYSLFGYATSLGSEGVILGMGVIPWLFVCRIGAGIAGATIPTAQAYIADVTGPTERGRGMALIGAAFGIGFTFGPLLGAAFVPGDVSDFQSRAGRQTAQTLSITAEQTQSIEAAMNAYRDERRQLGRSSSRGSRDALRAARDEKILSILSPEQHAAWEVLQAPSAAPGYVAGVLSALALFSAIFLLPESLKPDSRAAERHWLDFASLKQAVARPEIGTLLLTMFLTTFAFGQFESTLSLLTEFLGLGDRDNYYVFAYIGFILALSQGMLVRRLLPRLGEQRMGRIGTLLMTLGLVLVGYSGNRSSTTMLYFVLPLTVVGFSALNPSLQSLLSRRTAATDQGGILGLGQSMSALARILAPMMGMILNELDVTWPYWAGAAIMGAGALLFASLAREPTP